MSVTPELRPDDIEYLPALRKIRQALDIGITVYVIHNEFATRKELVLSPKNGMSFFGGSWSRTDPLWLLAWLYHGSMWIPVGGLVHWGYIAEKMTIQKWPADAKSLAAFIANLQNVYQIADGRTGTSDIRAEEL